MDVKNESPSGV